VIIDRQDGMIRQQLIEQSIREIVSYDLEFHRSMEIETIGDARH
jgi:hypothetical protein